MNTRFPPIRWVVANILLIACGDGITGSDTPAAIVITLASLEGPTMVSVVDTAPRVQCDVRLKASAQGPPLQQLPWGAGQVRWYFGINLSTPGNTEAMSLEEVTTAWGKGEISTGADQETGWRFSAGVPFAVTMKFDYLLPNRRTEDSALIHFSCGLPEPVPPPPTVTSIALSPGSGAPEFGSMLSVDFVLASNAGIWQSALVLSGACDTVRIFAERLLKTVSRTVSVRLPANCAADEPIGITVVARDASLQVNTSSIELSALQDRSPPLIYVSGNNTDLFRSAKRTFVGDSVLFSAHGIDNQGIHSIVWEELDTGIRDSIFVTGKDVTVPLWIVARQEWVGRDARFQFYSRDVAGLVSGTTVTASDSFKFYPTRVRPTVSVSVPGEVRDLAVDTKRSRVYLLQSSQNRVTIVSSSDFQSIGSVENLRGSGMDLTTSGDSLLVTLPDERALAVIDLTQPTLTAVRVPLNGLSTSAYQAPTDVTVSADGKAFIALDAVDYSLRRMIELDLTTGTQAFRTDVGTGGQIGPARLRTSLDHSLIVMNYADILQGYRAGSWGPIRQPSLIFEPATADLTGNRVALSLWLYDANLGFLGRVKTATADNSGYLPLTALSADGQYLYQGLPQGIARGSTDSFQLMDRVLFPFVPTVMRVTRDGALLVAARSSFGAGPSMIGRLDLP